MRLFVSVVVAGTIAKMYKSYKEKENIEEAPSSESIDSIEDTSSTVMRNPLEQFETLYIMNNRFLNDYFLFFILLSIFFCIFVVYFFYNLPTFKNVYVYLNEVILSLILSIHKQFVQFKHQILFF
jgi:hypothetical protein